jgi:ABC-type uncharacterized transport system permease subunit
MALLRYQWQNEVAYPANLAARVSSTFFFTVVYIIFLHLLFRKVGSIGSFSQNDMLVVFFLGQIGFFTTVELFYNGFTDMVQMINNGNFDFDLVRPVNIKSWAMLKGINPFIGFAEAIVPILLIGFSIKWQLVNVTAANFGAATAVVLVGIMMTYTLLFLFCLPAFRVGESSELLHIFWGMGPMAIPNQKLPLPAKIAAFSVLPSLLFGSIASSILLGKQALWPLLPIAIAVGFFAWYLQRILWRYALRIYSSASS